MIEPNTFKAILAENGGRLPLLTLDEFFSGNTEEDSIAPNQWGYGRPTLSELWDVLKKVESLSETAWVRVALHDDTAIAERGWDEACQLVGDAIVVCGAVLPAELEAFVNCEWLCSDGVIQVEADTLGMYSRVPPFRSTSRVWKSCGTNLRRSPPPGAGPSAETPVYLENGRAQRPVSCTSS